MRASRGATYYTKNHYRFILIHKVVWKLREKLWILPTHAFTSLMDPTSFSHQLFTIPPSGWIWIVFKPPELFGFVPSESFGFPVLANSNFLLPDCFCASPICFLRFSNDSFSVASCFSASERNFINTNWKHQSGFFWRTSLPILQNMIYSSLRSPAVSQTGRMKTGAFGWKHWKQAELVGQFKSVGG